jgi:hypothetical protein
MEGLGGTAMECVANYEIKSECSVVADDLVLAIKHPEGLYRARIRNVPRSTYTNPFLISLHLYFDAPALDEARDIADGHLAECLNMLAFITGSSFSQHRIRQIVDATQSGASGMRSLLMWGDPIEYEDPQPFLCEETSEAMERLLEFHRPPAIRRAMRWYRFGINASTPDDQYMFFWFALEIVAEHQKSTEKVPDRCPKCQLALYCETCKTNPLHRPYPKQAIRALLKAVDKNCDDATIMRLEKTRNSLMHGLTLVEIEGSLPKPHEKIVDVLGHLLWRALIHQFPREMFDGTMKMGFPSTYVSRKVHWVAHMQTIVPMDDTGHLDLSFTGTTIETIPDGPPQSALPTAISMTPEQHDRLGDVAGMNEVQLEMCRRIYERVEIKDGRVHAPVLSTDMTSIKTALERGDIGVWQDLFREILGDCSEG